MADQSLPTATRGSSSSSSSRPGPVPGPHDDEKEYEDLMSVMVDKLDSDHFMQELSAGFRLLSDQTTGLITPLSLLRGASAALGLHGMTAEEAEAMVKEGDTDGDGALNEAEFCVLMVRLSPGLMANAEVLLEREIDVELDRVASHG